MYFSKIIIWVLIIIQYNLKIRFIFENKQLAISSELQFSESFKWYFSRRAFEDKSTFFDDKNLYWILCAIPALQEPQ